MRNTGRFKMLKHMASQLMTVLQGQIVSNVLIYNCTKKASCLWAFKWQTWSSWNCSMSTYTACGVCCDFLLVVLHPLVWRQRPSNIWSPPPFKNVCFVSLFPLECQTSIMLTCMCAKFVTSEVFCTYLKS